MEQHAFAGDAIEVGRLHPGGTISPGVAMRPIVGDDEENVGPLSWLSHASPDGGGGGREKELTAVHSVQVNVE